jgi:hypothetical protein
MGWNFILSDHAGAVMARVVDALQHPSSGGLALIMARMLSHRGVHASSVERKAPAAVRTEELRDRRVISFAVRCPVPLQP